MRPDLAKGSAWLAGAGVTAVIGYLIATVAAGGRHPVWPYFLFGAAALLGFGLYFMGHRGGPSVAAGGIAGFRDPAMSRFSMLNTPEPTGQLAGPPNGSKVSHQELVTGVVRDLQPGTQAWIVVWPALEGAYWPQGEFPMDKSGGFRSVAYFGQSAAKNVGEQFILLLVVADPTASAQFRAFLKAPYRGMRDLPRGAQTLDQRTVVRR